MRCSAFLKSGQPWVWLTAGAVSLSLISVLGLLLLIGWKGLNYFWPAPLYQWQDAQGSKLIGQIYQRSSISLDNISDPQRKWSQEIIEKGEVERLSIKVANRDLYQRDFISVLAPDLKDQSQPENLAVFERTRGGDFFGTPIAVMVNGEKQTAQPLSVTIQESIERANTARELIDALVHNDLHDIGKQLASLQKQRAALQKSASAKLDSLSEEQQAQIAQFDQQQKQLQTQFKQTEQAIFEWQDQLSKSQILVKDMAGETTPLPLDTVLDAWYPNQMTFFEKLQHWGVQVKHFLMDSPRESNSEGGVFPAIFGTVLLVILMSVVVMPLGVMAAIYLHEYSGNSTLTKLIRIAVVNLAGVPSIVYGVFGLGFFVYTVGSSIDQIFYSDTLPTPTFGTPGLLWSAMTLAILTLPVVIVATEEGLARVPNSVRHGSYALGATKFETLWRITLPMVSPAIMTGLILAVARAAGEVAPLMLVGVVKLAPSLPIDGDFPFVHLERKFMHLGFHIYDVGFQTPNIEAARPLVFATSFLLITVVVGLNITAITIRNNLREKFKTLGND
ncbi:MAG: phosphate ABC transporter permease PstA [Vibrio sp.]